MNDPLGHSTNDGVSPHPRRSGTGPPWLGFLIGPAFVAIAMWFLYGPELDPPAVAEHVASRQAVRERLTTKPLRKTVGSPPLVRIGGFDRTCMDCHRTFPARQDPPRQLLQHKNIVLEHGVNNRCGHCHWDVDRNKLVGLDGHIVGFDQVDELCGKCHGPIYRDWERGAHGRTNGYWNKSKGKTVRLECSECHDPHRPRFPAMSRLEPLPPPHTLRANGTTPHGTAPDTMAEPGKPTRPDAGQVEQTAAVKPHDLEK